MKPKHTPGPWDIKSPTDFVGPFQHIVDRTGWTIAKLHETDSAPEFALEREANCRLISAAPDLLHVCELILKEWERPTEGVQTGELIARLSQYAAEAREAIKKARGES